MNKISYAKRFILSFLITLIITSPVLALNFDVSVDEEIKKKYNTNKIQEDTLPPLPKVDKQPSAPQKPQQTTTTQVPTTTPVYTTTVPIITKTDKKTALRIPSRTKFQVRSNQVISDWLREGNTVSFTSYAPVYKKNITIPAGTVFKGVIADSHRPQMSGNGGLVVLRVTSMNYNGKTVPLNAKITKANTKKIFLNNMKGKRQYWANVGKQIDKGENFFKKTRRTSKKLADNPVGWIISPIPTIFGLAGYAVTTVSSPVLAIFSKGVNISIPAGSNFEIKLLTEAYIY